MKHRAGLLLFPRRGAAPRPVAEPPAPAPAPPAAPRRPAQVHPRYLLVHLPAFALERCGHAADEVVVAVAEQRSATRIVAATPAALAQGLRVGMTLPEARAIVPAVVDVPHDAAAQRADHAALLPCFAHLGERLAAWGDGDVLVEVSRTAHLLGGEQGAADLARRRAEELGHHARVVVADDPCVARAIAAWGDRDEVVAPGAGAAAIADFSLEALEPSPALVAAARTIGVVRVGDWAALDPASITGRFGADGLRLHRLARGEAATRLPWNAPARGPAIASVVLGGPTVTLDPVFFVLPGLLRRLAGHLDAADAAAVRVAVRLTLDGAPPQVLRVRVGHPSRDPDRLLAVIRPRLERLRLAAPATELHVEVEEQAADRPWQPGLLERATSAEPVADLVARLADTLGESAVFEPYLRDEWQPERAWGARLFAPGTPAPVAPPHRKHDADPVAIQRAAEPDGPRPRPTLLLDPPEPIQVRSRDGAPVELRIDGRWASIVASEGPERLETGWWRLDGGISRDYWVVDLGGRTAWCFVDDTGGWRLHGWFD
jgi:protein ImuB